MKSRTRDDDSSEYTYQKLLKWVCLMQRPMCPMKPCGTNWVNVPCEPLKRETFSAQNKSSPDFYLHFMPREGENANPFITKTFQDLHTFFFFFTVIGVSHAGTRLRKELPSTPECLWAKRNLSAPEGGVESQKARCVGLTFTGRQMCQVEMPGSPESSCLCGEGSDVFRLVWWCFYHF